MLLTSVIIWLLFVVGGFLLIGITIKDVETVLEVALNKKKTLRNLKENKETKLQKAYHSIKTMLDTTGGNIKFSIVVILSFVLAIVGALLGIFTKNIFLAPCFALACGSIPVFFLQLKYMDFQKKLSEQLAMALTCITTSYERNDNIVLSFEENLDIIDNPLKKVFENFVCTIKFVNPNITEAILTLKKTIKNTIFVEWCEALTGCVSDSTLKFVLPSIVAKYTALKVTIAKTNNIINEAKSFSTISVFLNLGISLAVYFWMPVSFEVTISSPFFNIVIAINILISILMFFKTQVDARNFNYDL